MTGKQPYTHILKNFFYEQAQEIIPLLLPNFRVEESFESESRLAHLPKNLTPR